MRRFLAQYGDGDNVEEVFLVTDKQLRANRNGNPYLLLELTDRTMAMSARLWNAGDNLVRGFNPGDFLFVSGRVQLFQGALQMIINHLERAEGEKVDLTDFLPHTPFEIPKLLDRLKTSLRKVGNPHLRGLAEAFLLDDEFLRGFCQVPAGVKQHHAYVGGLLEHVVTLIDGAERLAPLYPGVDKDLLVVGCFLHDAGKVRELTIARGFAYTDEGQLVGHLAIGVEMLNEKVAGVPEMTGEPFPKELLLRLKHLILSHHGTYEFGSPRLPMTPEAVALHALDTLDSKIHSTVRDIKDAKNQGGSWTPYNQATQRRLFIGSGGAEE